MKKQQLKDNINNDVQKMRGAMLEILESNRSLNTDLVDQMAQGDFSLLEEYNLLVKSILEATKALTEIHAQTPKIIKDINNVQEEKAKINLNDLIDEDEPKE